MTVLLIAYSDPGAPDSAAAKGMLNLSFGKFFEKVQKRFVPYQERLV